MEDYRVASASDFAEVCEFYKEVCEKQADDEYGADWHYGIYPTEDDLKKNLEKSEIHTCRIDGRVVSAVVLEESADPMYRDVDWKIKCPDHEVLTIHLFAIHPDFRGRQVSRNMMNYMFEYGKKHGFKSVQLDVLKGNVPAEKLYIKSGFCFVEERPVWYEDIGDQVAHLYEKNLG
ncbi:GNAT family N-acetyltransferase [Atopobium sp. oral taxon 199]|uniref:GNAT family N-acetyltransferase n=1 Tax=Atopobium sp. oral taxon 199 TaxID=712156 RepID=UPI00034EB4D1|nr:GNAT family N-acetyltransferase [Atopobium sp. oral taxon 199]EPD77971.1 hypothetical protein HMPREF1527_00273 [Atopobium sp. oral taxon 199 str. F0494]